jgi:quercetin dioxygenase-like cupin family protein
LYTVVILVLAFASTPTTVNAQGGKKDGQKRGALTWGPAPANLPPGAKMAIEKGDPTKPGEFSVRFLLPDGYKIPPHSHPTDEHLRVRSGTFLTGMGDKIDLAAAKALVSGDTAYLPAKMRHWGVAKGETIVSVSGPGPFAITYVNPADAPKP